MSERCLGRRGVILAIFTCLLSHTSFPRNPLLFSVCPELCFLKVGTDAAFRSRRSAEHLKDAALLQKEILEVLS